MHRSSVKFQKWCWLVKLFAVCRCWVLQSTWNTVWRRHIQTNNGVFWRIPKQATSSTICVENVSSKWYVCFFCSALRDHPFMTSTQMGR